MVDWNEKWKIKILWLVVKACHWSLISRRYVAGISLHTFMVQYTTMVGAACSSVSIRREQVCFGGWGVNPETAATRSRDKRLENRTMLVLLCSFCFGCWHDSSTLPTANGAANNTSALASSLAITHQVQTYLLPVAPRLHCLIRNCDFGTWYK